MGIREEHIYMVQQVSSLLKKGGRIRLLQNPEYHPINSMPCTIRSKRRKRGEVDDARQGRRGKLIHDSSTYTICIEIDLSDIFRRKINCHVHPDFRVLCIVQKSWQHGFNFKVCARYLSYTDVSLLCRLTKLKNQDLQ